PVAFIVRSLHDALPIYHPRRLARRGPLDPQDVAVPDPLRGASQHLAGARPTDISGLDDRPHPRPRQPHDPAREEPIEPKAVAPRDRKSTRLNSSHVKTS